MCGLAVVVAASGCASLQVKKDKVAQAKTVAIIGYQGVLMLDDARQQGSGLADTIGAIKGAADAMSGQLEVRRIAEAEAGYAVLSQKLATGMGWTMVERATVAANPAYAAWLAKYPNMGLAVMGMQRLADVLRADVVSLLNDKERMDLAKALQVDAVAVASIQYHVGETSGFAIGGMGKVTKYPRATVDFALYPGNEGEPVWRDRRAVGETTKDGLATTMGAEINENEAAVLDAAVKSCFDALLQRYREAK